ncbi:MAG TPA: protein kinase [Solirubrobacteraceae bacterium]|nr:protein kinase [Solirubrobacteraceae bacterium]
MRPAIDTTLEDGRYRLEQRLGAGGMATVWLAVDERLGRSVAVKIVADTIADDDNWIRRFKREARAAAALSHPGVVSVFDYGVEDGRPYLVMEYVPGGTLAQRLASGSSGGDDPRQRLDTAAGRMPHPQHLARELLEALGAVHAAGILHRDIKPANLLLDAQGHVRLTDFGIAQPQDSTSLTRTGMVVGTLRYLAPEVAAGRPATVQSDLYSAGVVIGQVAGERRAPPLDALVAMLTAPDPGERPASAAAALQFLADATTTTRPVPSDEGVTQPMPADAHTTRPMPADGRTAPPARADIRTMSPIPDGLGVLGSPPVTRAHPRREILVAGAGAALVVLIVIVIVVTAGGGSGGSPAKIPSPAPAQSTVARQVQALERIVVSATRR